MEQNEEIVSLRGKLIKEIVSNFCEKSYFVSFDEIEKTLQTELDERLKFETKISDLKQDVNSSYGKILFNDENDVVRVVDFTVITKKIEKYDKN